MRGAIGTAVHHRLTAEGERAVLAERPLTTATGGCWQRLWRCHGLRKLLRERVALTGHGRGVCAGAGLVARAGVSDLEHSPACFATGKASAFVDIPLTFAAPCSSFAGDAG